MELEMEMKLNLDFGFIRAPSNSIFVSETKMEMELDFQWTGGRTLKAWPPPEKEKVNNECKYIFLLLLYQMEDEDITDFGENMRRLLFQINVW